MTGKDQRQNNKGKLLEVFDKTGFLFDFNYSSMVTKSRKYSVIKSTRFVPKALTSDTLNTVRLWRR